MLAVEVSDSTLRTDRTVKATLYGQAGINEYWVVNINGRTLEVFRQPGANGYTNVTTLTENETVRPLSAPQAEIRVVDLLP